MNETSKDHITYSIILLLSDYMANYSYKYISLHVTTGVNK